MTPRPARASKVAAAALLLLPLLPVAGCGGSSGGGDGPTAPNTATVTFLYLSEVAIDPAIQAGFADCVQSVGRTHIHPSWSDFVRIDMTAVGDDRWTITFTDVPVGSDQRIRISDPNACDRHPTGASTIGVFANGVELTRVVDTPGAGIEPGVGFRVAADGTVTP